MYDALLVIDNTSADIFWKLPESLTSDSCPNFENMCLIILG
jgi:hypothetical protein